MDRTVIERDLATIDAELPPRSPDRPAQCLSYNCDWQGTTLELATRNRKGPMRPLKDGAMAQITIESLHCPQCGTWNRNG